MLRAARICIALTLAVAGIVALPAPALAVAPENDDYLRPAPVVVRSAQKARETRDTREATVQTDLFGPDPGGGGIERTDCGGARIGATVWYDFRPGADGAVTVDAGGFDAVIAIYEYDPASMRIGSRVVDCVNETAGAEELVVDVKGGKFYRIQIGGVDAGVGPATGLLDFALEYFADRDGDGVLDEVDECPDKPGTVEGCPERLRAMALLRVAPTASGVQIASLSVDVPRGARVRLVCTRGCSLKRSRTALKAGALRFADLRGRRLPAKARLEVFVTKRRSIGSYIRYTMTRGSFTRIDRCLAPGSIAPRRRCT